MATAAPYIECAQTEAPNVLLVPQDQECRDAAHGDFLHGDLILVEVDFREPTGVSGKSWLRRTPVYFSLDVARNRNCALLAMELVRDLTRGSGTQVERATCYFDPGAYEACQRERQHVTPSFRYLGQAAIAEGIDEDE